jgi:hypothetical protein
VLKVLNNNKTIIDLSMANKEGTLRNQNMHTALVSKGLFPFLTKPDCVLNHLDLEGIQIGNQGIIALSEAICLNMSLISLNIANNKLHSQGAAIAIAKIIRTCHQIQTLNISRNRLENKGMAIVLAAYTNGR